MCKGQFARRPTRNDSLLLSSLESFSQDSKGRVPSNRSKLLTILGFSVFLAVVEQICRRLFASLSYLHPILEDEKNRHILARHLGVDVLGCFCVAFFGLRARHVYKDYFDTVIWGKNAMPKPFETRLFTYHAESSRILTLFLGYQAKNTIDSILWQDGIVFYIHHILAVGAAWGGLFPDSAHYYAVFYFGISELSTCVLCALANFDDEFGVNGLGDAFPLTKLVFGGLFATCFIVCRVLMWSTISYYFCTDVWRLLQTDDPRLVGRKTWFKFTLIANAALSLLQVLWLGEIFLTGKKELENMGFL